MIALRKMRCSLGSPTAGRRGQLCPGYVGSTERAFGERSEREGDPRRLRLHPVSEAGALDKNLRTQEMELFAYGIRQELMFTDDASGGSFDRPGWTALMERVCPGDTVAVAFFDRFARNFYEGVMIQKELAGRRINIVAIREGIDTSDDSAGGKFYRRIMLANGQYWRDTTSERVRSGQNRARAEGKHIGRLSALDANQVNWARRMAAEQESFRSIARALGKSPTTVMRAVLGIGAYGE